MSWFKRFWPTSRSTARERVQALTAFFNSRPPFTDFVYIDPESEADLPRIFAKYSDLDLSLVAMRLAGAALASTKDPETQTALIELPDAIGEMARRLARGAK